MGKLRRGTCAAFAVGTMSLVGAAAQEVRAGAGKHDLSGVESGVSLQGQLLFGAGPHARDRPWGLRPYLTFSGTVGGNGFNFWGGGIAIDRALADGWFVELQVGAAGHDGRVAQPPITETDEFIRVAEEERTLGCDILIHLSPSVGRMLTDRLSVALYYEHLSNGQFTCDPFRDKNEGLDNAGVRVAYRY